MSKKRIFGMIIGACVLITAAAVIIFTARANRKFWYVEAGYEEAWARVLREAGSVPVKMSGIKTYIRGQEITNPGVVITTRREESAAPFTLYRRLSSDLEYEGSLVLALDPWMIFSRHTNPYLSSARVFSDTEHNFLLVPGTEAGAVAAWHIRLTQNGAGSFPPGGEAFGIDELLAGKKFPPQCLDYTWQDVLEALLTDEPFYTYAPLSAVHGFQNPLKQIFAASPFPEDDYSQYSVQAKILWASPQFSDKDEARKLIGDWLRKPEIQTIAANVLGWIPASPAGVPRDPVSRSSHINWLTSTFVYEISYQAAPDSK